MNLASADILYDLGFAAGSQTERERIIKLIKEVRSERLSPEEALVKGWRFDEPSGIWWLPQDTLIALIKGENK